MEPAIWMEGSEEGNILGNEASKPTSDFAAPKQAADPVVYKLVRVDFDGRLVPPTDNELMEVENFFDYENSQILSVADVVQTAGFGFGEDDLPDKHFSSGVEVFSQYENSKGGEEQLNTNVECDDDMMQIVAEEERHQAASDLPVHPSTDVNIGKSCFGQPENLSVVENKDPSEIPVVGMLSTSGSTLHDIGTNPSGSPRDSLNMQGKFTENETSASNVSTTLKPDFSVLRGEINLDKFTIRGLQETFRATFGRETTVKDKQWLKRRIAMGLVNTCDIPMTRFTIKDNTLVKKVEDENCEKVDDVLVGDIGLSGNAVKDVHVDSDNKTEDAKSTRLNSLLGGNVPDDNSPIDQRAAKRVRKPTKRYIEESSDLETQETVERLIPSDKHSGVTEYSSSSAVRPSWEGRSSSINIIMRPDSLGGSGFLQVPRVSRIRRCRPRKVIITLTPSGLESQLVKDAVKVGDSQLAKIGGQKDSEARAVPFKELPSVEVKSEKLCSEIDDIAQMEEELQEPISADSSGNNSNGDFTAKGGTRRKHHRAWSLSEVVKLVDGVSRYGAGRWSEIKRVSFASYSYRTSVDLKDKWRNLLKASFAAMPSGKGMSHKQQQQQQQRKATSTPIPTPILLKVRELAEMNGQVPRNFKASSGNGGASVNEN